MNLFTTAVRQTQKLLAGREGRQRWRRLWGLAAIAGIAGAGAPPPPLGLLQALTADPTVRGQVLGNPVVVGGLLFLALFLLVMGGFGRAFTFAFLEGILTGNPQSANFRKYLRVGALHFAATAAVSAPLYAVLFLGEARVAHDVTTRLTTLLADPAATPEAMLSLLGLGLLKFLLVLVPWTLLTFPLMVLQYELLPARLVREWVGKEVWKCGSVEVGGSGHTPSHTHTPTHPHSPDLGLTARLVLQSAFRHPGQAAGYLALRLGLQILGNSAALLAALICLPVAALLGGPIVGVGWGVAHLLGGPSTPGGVGVLTVAGLLAAVVLYVLLCGALIPVAVLIHALALEAATPLPKRPNV